MNKSQEKHQSLEAGIEEKRPTFFARTIIENFKKT
jgi:hypothetical protein